jgi:hypothetical protein
VQSVSNVPDCGIGGRYRIDFPGMPFRARSPQLAVENFREFKGQILKTALSAVNTHPGLSATSTPPASLQLESASRRQKSWGSRMSGCGDRLLLLRAPPARLSTIGAEGNSSRGSCRRYERRDRLSVIVVRVIDALADRPSPHPCSEVSTTDTRPPGFGTGRNSAEYPAAIHASSPPCSGRTRLKP